MKSLVQASVVRWGGICLVAGALAFIAVFSYLAAKFNYPDVLDGPAATVLPALLATGRSGRAVWTIYAFLPLIWIPAASRRSRRFQRTGAARCGSRCSSRFWVRLR